MCYLKGFLNVSEGIFKETIVLIVLQVEETIFGICSLKCVFKEKNKEQKVDSLLDYSSLI